MIWHLCVDKSMYDLVSIPVINPGPRVRYLGTQHSIGYSTCQSSLFCAAIALKDAPKKVGQKVRGQSKASHFLSFTVANLIMLTEATMKCMNAACTCNPELLIVFKKEVLHSFSLNFKWVRCVHFLKVLKCETKYVHVCIHTFAIF